MKNSTFLTCLIITLFMACQQSQTDTTDNTTASNETTLTAPAETPSETSREKKPLTEAEIPSFIIKPYKDETATPKSTIFVNIRNHEAEVAKAVPCKKIEPADYKNYKIPAEAVEACGGSQAGSSEYFYLIKKPDAEFFMVMHTKVDEQTPEGDFKYNSVMSFAYGTQ